MHVRMAVMIVAMGLMTVAAFAQQKGPNGGLLSGTSGHQLELVAAPGELTVYLLEDGKPHDSKGASLQAVVQEGGKRSSVNFVDQDGKRLVAKLAAPLAKGTIVVLTGKDEHGGRLNARYVLN